MTKVLIRCFDKRCIEEFLFDDDIFEDVVDECLTEEETFTDVEKATEFYKKHLNNGEQCEVLKIR
ncbi:MAG: hypothetical protein QXV17_10580 [Candidatus Micrarchaeaceae archaeon]